MAVTGEVIASEMGEGNKEIGDDKSLGPDDLRYEMISMGFNLSLVIFCFRGVASFAGGGETAREAEKVSTEVVVAAVEAEEIFNGRVVMILILLSWSTGNNSTILISLILPGVRVLLSIQPHQKPPIATLMAGNLARMVRLVESRVPQMLLHPLPRDIVGPNISLRLFPIACGGQIPVATGYIPYVSSLKLLQVLSRTLFLPQHSSLKIIKTKVSPAKLFTTTSNAKDFDETRGYALYPKASRITVTWTSSPSEILSGIFIFELNEEETKVIVHTIEEVQFISKAEPPLNAVGPLG